MVACCSINMRLFKTSGIAVLLLSVLWSSDGAPADSKESLLNGESSELGDRYDQRQNGTENYRIHVDGLVLVVAPVEALLLAGGIPGATDSNIFGVSQQDGLVAKPKPEETEQKPDSEESTPKPEITGNKPLEPKSSHRPGLRLMSLLSPFLRRVGSHH